MKNYSYDHCGGNKKNSTCTKRNPIKLEVLEQQIEMLLEEYTILPEFERWAIEALNRNNDKEIEERTKIYEMQHKTVVETQTEIDNLTKMRYRDLIDDNTFVKERDALKDKLARLQATLRQTEGRASKWLDLTEQVFSFACYARKEFIVGDLQRKREIFSALGQNFYIKGGKVFITERIRAALCDYPQVDFKKAWADHCARLQAEERDRLRPEELALARMLAFEDKVDRIGQVR